MSKEPKGELLQGTLSLLILRVLAAGPNHGFAIARRVRQLSSNVLRIEEGSLYPALHRMELDGWIQPWWAVTENNRKARYYRLTRRGRKQLEKETERWRAVATAMTTVLREA